MAEQSDIRPDFERHLVDACESIYKAAGFTQQVDTVESLRHTIERLSQLIQQEHADFDERGNHIYAIAKTVQGLRHEDDNAV